MTTPITVAIADDHILYRKGVVTIVGRHNVRVVAEAANGKELLDKLEVLDQLPQICILDVSMPIMGGYDTLLEIRRRWPAIKVLILTMLDSASMAKTMLNEGAAGYFVKDGPPDGVEKAIEAIIRTGHYESELTRRANRKD